MSRNRNTFRHRNVLRYVTAIPIPNVSPNSIHKPAQRLRIEEEGQRSGASFRRTTEASAAQFALTPGIQSKPSAAGSIGRGKTNGALRTLGVSRE